MRASLILFLSFYFSFNAEALEVEIQCQTKWRELLMVVKTSPETSRTYLLFLNDTEVEKYWLLPRASIQLSQELFSFEDDDTEIKIDLIEKLGEINSLGAIIRGTKSIELFDCKRY